MIAPDPRLWVGPLIGAACLAAAGVAQYQLDTIEAGETMTVELPSEYLGLSIDPRIVRRLLGTQVIAADLVWIDTLIKSDIAHEKAAYTSLYRAFRAVVELDPDNVYAYYVGGIYLSILKDDIHGATALLKEGAQHLETHPHSWPDAWKLPFILGYNLAFEENDVEDGSRWIKKAGEMPNAPLYVRELARRVETERGRLEVAERILNDVYRHTAKPEERKRIEDKMLEIGVRHDLLDLNERFQAFVSSTKAGAFSKKRQFEIFKRSIGHNGRDLMGRPLGIDSLGRIAPLERADKR